MDLLQKLLEFATGAEAPEAGEQRVAAVLAHLRELADDGTDLAVLEQQAVARFEELYADGEYDPKNVSTLEALDDITAAARQLAAERAQAKTERDERVAALAARVRTAPAADDDLDEPGEPDTDPTGDGSEPPGASGAGDPQPAPDAPLAEPSPAGAVPADPAPVEPNPPAEPAPVPAVASAAPAAPARRTSTALALSTGRTVTPAAPARAPQAPVKTLRTFTITASAEIPEYPFGQKLTVEELGDASVARFMTLPVGQPASGPIKANVARIHRKFDPSITLSGDQGDVAILDRVADEKRLPGGSLVAAAQQRALTAAAQAPSVINDVWCTPSETDYTLCPPLATDDGLLDIPRTGMPARGGIRFPVWTQYPEQAADTARNGWRGTAITYPEPPANPGEGLDNPAYFHRGPNDTPPGQGLGNLKKCISGPCVEWREVRQSLAYLCIESDILRDRTFPEGIARFMSDVLIHHQHYLNEIYVNYLVSHADPIPPFSVQNGAGSIGSVSLTVVDRLALLITWMRGAYKMARGSTLELVLPEWFGEYLKRDLEKKQNRPFGAVSDTEVLQLFAAYSSRVQWIRDWQELPNGAPVGPDGAPRVMPPDAWPSQVQMLAYPAGSWVLSEGNILTLGVQYDYTLLKENRYSASFVEDAWMLVNRCNRTFVLSLTDLCANGAIGPQRDACPTGGGAPAPAPTPEPEPAPPAEGADDPGNGGGEATARSTSRSGSASRKP